MPTLILSSRYSEDSKLLRKTAEGLGWNAMRLETISSVSDLSKVRTETVVYGEFFFARAVCGKLRLALLGPTPEWLGQIPQDYLLRELRVDVLGTVRTFRGRRFIKPATGKAFPAQVYEKSVRNSEADSLPDNTPVLVCEPVLWEAELRCFILNRQIATIAAYNRDGKPLRNKKTGWPVGGKEVEAGLEFAQKMLVDSRIDMPQAVVIDIGQIKGRGWAIVEANEAWASGIYGCDRKQILEVLKKACVPFEQLNADQDQWITNKVLSQDETDPGVNQRDLPRV
jgi:hypothetical protein